MEHKGPTMFVKNRLTLAMPCIAALLALTSVARADTITVTVYNQCDFNAPCHGALNNAGPQGPSLGSTTITNGILNAFAPNNSTNYTIGSFLTSDGAVLGAFSNGTVAGLGLNDKEIDFAGNMYLTAGKLYTINHDDGAILSLNNVVVFNSGGATVAFPSTFTVASTGEYSFLLRYAEVNGAPATINADTPFSPVPEPGSLVLLGTGIVGLAGMVRRKMSL
jgi:hypothetical protein